LDTGAERKDMEAGAKTAISVNKEVAGGLGLKELPVAIKIPSKN
jgi:hypothetical protein